MLGSARVVSDVTTIDASGRAVTVWIYADAGAHTTTQSTTVQGISNYGLKTWQDGYLASDPSVSGVTTTYAYDSSGRLASTVESTTNGSATNTYYSSTDYLLTVTTTTGSSASTTSTYGYSWNTGSNSRVLHGIVWVGGSDRWGSRSSLPQKNRMRTR